MRISRKKFRAFFEIFVSGPTASLPLCSTNYNKINANWKFVNSGFYVHLHGTSTNLKLLIS